MIKQIRANYDAKGIEKDVQAYWDETDAYHKTKEHRANGERFYFVDGPPYTTGAIHLGTAMNKTVKDILLRYWRMCGYNVRDQPGFDMASTPRRTLRSSASTSSCPPAGSSPWASTPT